jgi:hypothetical protein
MRVSIKVIRELDGAAVHELIVDVSEKEHLGGFVDELFEKVRPDMETSGAARYKLVIELAE